MASNNDYINYKDFDIKKLSLCEGRNSENHGGFWTFNIEYEYPDGELRSLRLRSPLLFSYGIKKSKLSKDHYMLMKSFYDENEMGEKEIEFRKTLDNISDFLRKEIENKKLGDKDRVLKRDHLGKMDIITDNGSFFPKLREIKFNENKKVKSEIKTVFYEKGKGGKLSERKPSFIRDKPCKVIVYMDIADIFIRIKNPVFKIRTYISDAIIIKTDVPHPNSWVKTSNISIGSDDEGEEKIKTRVSIESDDEVDKDDEVDEAGEDGEK